mgnify:CR=1 FL=1
MAAELLPEIRGRLGFLEAPLAQQRRADQAADRGHTRIVGRDGGLDFFQLEGLALDHAVLLATAFDYCVHSALRSVSLLAFL